MYSRLLGLRPCHEGKREIRNSGMAAQQCTGDYPLANCLRYMYLPRPPSSTFFFFLMFGALLTIPIPSPYSSNILSTFRLSPRRPCTHFSLIHAYGALLLSQYVLLWKWTSFSFTPPTLLAVGPLPTLVQPYHHRFVNFICLTYSKSSPLY